MKIAVFTESGDIPRKPPFFVREGRLYSTAPAKFSYCRGCARASNGKCGLRMADNQKNSLIHELPIRASFEY